MAEFVQSKEQALAVVQELVTDFHQIFDNPSGAKVLKALEKFCYILETTYYTGDKAPDPLVLEGRRQVFLFIAKNLNLSSEHLFQIATGRSNPYQMEVTNG